MKKAHHFFVMGFGKKGIRLRKHWRCCWRDQHGGFVAGRIAKETARRISVWVELRAITVTSRVDNRHSQVIGSQNSVRLLVIGNRARAGSHSLLGATVFAQRMSGSPRSPKDRKDCFADSGALEGALRTALMWTLPARKVAARKFMGHGRRSCQNSGSKYQ